MTFRSESESFTRKESTVLVESIPILNVIAALMPSIFLPP